MTCRATDARIATTLIINDFDIRTVTLAREEREEANEAFLTSNGRRILALLLAIFLVLSLFPDVAPSGMANYLALHITLEIVAITIAFMVFAIGWRSWLSAPPLPITLIACGFLGVGLLDISHLLSYQGMPAFITPGDPEKAINFWLASRLLAGLTLLSAVSLSWTRSIRRWQRNATLLATLLAVLLLSLLFLFASDHVPATFDAEEGLTTFKVAFEYALVALYLTTSAVLWLRRRRIREPDTRALNLAILVTALSELYFTLYTDVTDIYNLSGHLYKIVAYYFLYRARVVMGIETPSRQLLRAERRMAATLNAMPDMMLELDDQGRIHQYHSQQSHLPVPEAELEGHSFFEFVPPPVEHVIRQAMADIARHGVTQGRQCALTVRGKERWYELSGTRLHDPDRDGTETRYLLLIREITSRIEAERERDRSRRFLETALDNLPLGLAINSVDEDIEFLYMNDRFPVIYGVTREQLAEPDGFWKHVYRDPATRESMKRRVIEDVASGDPQRMRWENIPLLDADGGTRYITAQNIPLPEEELSLSLVMDVTAQREAEREQRISAIAFQSQEAIIITDADRRILRVNLAFTDVTGFGQQEVIDKPLDFLNAGENSREVRQSIERSLAASGRWRGELWHRHKDGSLYPQRMTLTAVRDETGAVTHYVAHLIDTTALHEAERTIEQLAFYDPLTGLGNRSLMLQRLQESVGHQGVGQHSGALLYVDLDHFKIINDTLGHHAGDILLAEVASRLRASVDPDNFIARNGADEFIVIINEAGSNTQEAATHARQVADQLVNRLSGTYDIQGNSYHSSCSIGIAIYGDDSQDAIEVLKQADIATNQVKQIEERHVGFFDPAMEARIRDQLSLDRDLREALEQEQFELWYQPKVRANGSVTGAEALIRWHHPRKGLLGPGSFIPAAEASGLIGPIEQWVLDTAIRQLAEWQSRDETRRLSLNVNVTSSQFYRLDFTDQLLEMLSRHAVDPRGLVLEFTESTLIADIDSARQRMEALRRHGVHFAIDDFGTGYSSLTYLSHLPLDQLKIDQSFVQNLHADSSNAAIVRAIIEMARVLELEVLAEGVETSEQLTFLRNAGCDLYQGYLFGRPVPVSDFRAE